MARKASRAIGFASTAAILAAALGGCTIGQRAEAVYFQQHQVLAALTAAIDAIEPRDPELADVLYDTEDGLNVACAPLWSAGNRRIRQQEIDGSLKWEVFQSLDDCAAKTREVERMIWRVAPDTARLYLHGLGRKPEAR